jgi:hypothetical protein
MVHRIAFIVRRYTNSVIQSSDVGAEIGLDGCWLRDCPDGVQSLSKAGGFLRVHGLVRPPRAERLARSPD